MDASLSRQFLRLKRSGVKVPNWLSNHMELLSLLVPEKDLQRVFQANGQWDGVADSIKNLMGSSRVGKTVFSFRITLANAAHYKGVLEKLLEEIKDLDFDEEATKDYKTKAKRAADSFKAMGFIQPYRSWESSSPPPKKIMFPTSSCFPRVHASPEFMQKIMLPQSSCFPRVHAELMGLISGTRCPGDEPLGQEDDRHQLRERRVEDGGARPPHRVGVEALRANTMLYQVI